MAVILRRFCTRRRIGDPVLHRAAPYECGVADRATAAIAWREAGCASACELDAEVEAIADGIFVFDQSGGVKRQNSA